MKWVRVLTGLALLAAICAGGWIVLFRPEWLRPQMKEEAAAVVETEVPVHVGKITRATLHHYVEAFGTVAFEIPRSGQPAAGARVSAPGAGVVTEVLCSEGQRVEKGASLFQLDDRVARAEEAKAAAALASAHAALARLKASKRPELIAVAKSALDKARNATAAAEKEAKRQQALIADQVTSQKQLDEAELQFKSAREDQAAAEKQLALVESTPMPEEIAEASAKITEAEKALAGAELQRSLLTIKAPLAATVVKINVNPGESVDTTTVLAELTDLGRLEITATVPAPDLKGLKQGQEVEVLPASSGDEQAGSPHHNQQAGRPHHKGTLAFIGLQADAKNDSVAVRVSIPAGAGLRPGQFAHVRIADVEHKDCLVVPVESVFRDKSGNSVIAVLEGEKASLRHVAVGLRENELLEVESTEIKEAEKQEEEKKEEAKKGKAEEEKKEEKIKAGDTVVTEGAYGLPDETRVRVIGE